MFGNDYYHDEHANDKYIAKFLFTYYMQGELKEEIICHRNIDYARAFLFEWHMFNGIKIKIISGKILNA